MWQELFTALALLCVLEGIFPFLAPGLFRQAMFDISQKNEKVLRFGGLTCMVMGVLFLYFIR